MRLSTAGAGLPLADELDAVMLTVCGRASVSARCEEYIRLFV